MGNATHRGEQTFYQEGKISTFLFGAFIKVVNIGFILCKCHFPHKFMVINKGLWKKGLENHKHNTDEFSIFKLFALWWEGSLFESKLYKQTLTFEKFCPSRFFRKSIHFTRQTFDWKLKKCNLSMVELIVDGLFLLISLLGMTKLFLSKEHIFNTVTRTLGSC